MSKEEGTQGAAQGIATAVLDVAHHINAILNHPDAPKSLRDDLTDWLSDHVEVDTRNLADLLPKASGRGQAPDTVRAGGYSPEVEARRGESEQEMEAYIKGDEEIADKLADFMADPLISMDVWDFVACSLEELGKRCNMGFQTPAIVRAAVPILLKDSDSRDMILGMLEAIEKRRAQDALIYAGKSSSQ